MRLKNLDLLVAAAIVVMNVLWALLPSHPPVGIILALPLVFLLPGYTLNEALFYKHPFDGIYHFTISIALSLIIDILSGFTLNIFPAGLRAMPWTVSLGLLTVVFSLLAAYLRKGSSIDEIRLPKFHFGKYESILLGLSIVVAILSLQYSIIKVAQQPHPGFTQFWMLPSKPTNNNCAVHLGIHSFESASVTYRMTMAVNNVQTYTWSSIVLAPQEEWNQLVPIPPRSNSIYVEVRLYKSDKPETVYHEVHTTLNDWGESTSRKIQC